MTMMTHIMQKTILTRKIFITTIMTISLIIMMQKIIITNTTIRRFHYVYHVNGGKWVKDTTLVKYNGKWYYVQKGIVNFKANTKVKYNGKWYTVRNGVVK